MSVSLLGHGLPNLVVGWKGKLGMSLRMERDLLPSVPPSPWHGTARPGPGLAGAVICSLLRHSRRSLGRMNLQFYKLFISPVL